ncbi:MAG: hypothetical protein Q8P07_02015 [bacterium]|nr:hypothetical protein [bacterium]
MNEFASAGYTAGQLNAIVKILKKQAGEDGPDSFLRGELSVSKPGQRWHEHGGIIYLPPVISDGTTGPQWIERHERKGFRLSDDAKKVLHSDEFKPTNGVITEIAVLKGVLFEDNGRTTKKVRVLAEALRFTKPNAEVACLIRESFSDEEIKAMGLWWIIAMHEPISSGGDPGLLSAGRGGDGRWLYACSDYPDGGWDRHGGFAFAVSQVSS